VLGSLAFKAHRWRLGKLHEDCSGHGLAANLKYGFFWQGSNSLRKAIFDCKMA